ncbi:MAG TPA: protein-export chaperone SecB [Beijerinckiaceae bacterium]|nr:protein-export chaperone SecB [Beijerinckiaceae bacterium]
MSQTPNAGQTEDTAPQLNALAQYIKDLSFENPRAPRSLTNQDGSAPNIQIQVNVNAQPIGGDDYEVELKLEGSAGTKPNLLFSFELNYGGVFRLRNIPQEHIGGVLMVECPRLLFPFARQIVANAVRDGGFPPLYMDPIDFLALYQQRVAELQSQQGQPPVKPS